MTPDLTGLIARAVISPMTPFRARDERGWGMMMLPDTITARADLGVLA
jgi:hypothetical protein